MWVFGNPDSKHSCTLIWFKPIKCFFFFSWWLQNFLIPDCIFAIRFHQVLRSQSPWKLKKLNKMCISHVMCIYISAYKCAYIPGTHWLREWSFFYNMGLPTFFNRKIFPTLLKKPLHSLLFVNLEKITNGNEENCQPFVGESR